MLRNAHIILTHGDAHTYTHACTNMYMHSYIGWLFFSLTWRGRCGFYIELVYFFVFDDVKESKAC